MASYKILNSINVVLLTAVT